MEKKEFVKHYWRWGVCAVLCILNIFVWYTAAHEGRGGKLTISVLDVGQGDAIFIDAPNGNQLLLDGGPPGSLLAPLAKVLPFYDRSIDVLALSHPHLDHFGGLSDLLGRYEVGGIVTSGTRNNTPDYETFKQKEKISGVEEIVLRAGQRIALGGETYLDVLLPQAEVSESTPHNGMLVLRLRYGSTSVLFTGDMEMNLEEYLGARDGAALQSTVLKVGHHGSKTSTSEKFMSLVQPEYAVISVGAKNSYGHPNEEALKVLRGHGAEVFRTDEEGTITFVSDGRTISFLR